ncbi:MAG: hypothetical protein M3015_12895 [Bacteroidota bacterium]|nr:hypothetical protein [Bacteroidota bacterium]
MKKIREIKSSKTQKRNEYEPKNIYNSTREKSSAWPEEHEEQRGIDIRMKPQPFPSSAKPEKKKNKKKNALKTKK